MATTMQGAVETPSGKGAGDENFPVGSFLLPKRLRPHVATFTPSRAPLTILQTTRRSLRLKKSAA